MGFCTKCGCKLVDNANFCFECGADIQNEKSINNNTNNAKKNINNANEIKNVNELAETLAKTTSDEEKFLIISAFQIQIQKDEILEFMNLAKKRIQSTPKETSAWKTKIKEIFEIAKSNFNDRRYLNKIENRFNDAMSQYYDAKVTQFGKTMLSIITKIGFFLKQLLKKIIKLLKKSEEFRWFFGMIVLLLVILIINLILWL